MSRITRLVIVWTAAIIIGLLVGGAVLGDGTAGLVLAAAVAWIVKALLQLILGKLEDHFVPRGIDSFRPPDRDGPDDPAASSDSDEPQPRRRFRRRP